MFRQLGGFNSAGSTARSFIHRLKRNDGEAWVQYDNIYGAVAFTRYVQAGADEDLAAELTQQVMCNVHNGISNYEEKSFRGWLWLIAKRVLINHIRDAAKPDRARGGSDVIQNLEALSVDSEWDRSEEAAIARAFFDAACGNQNVSNAELDVLWDHLGGLLSAQQAAEKLRMLVGTFYKRKSRLLIEINRLRGLGE